jgi:N-methylhydantoinase B
VTRYSVRRGSGGRGRHCGGDGVVREIETLVPAQITILNERRRQRPYGLQGGGAGRAGRDILESGAPRRRTQRTRLLSKTTVEAPAGTRVRIETPGGGGWGSPGRRVSEASR